MTRTLRSAFAAGASASTATGSTFWAATGSDGALHLLRRSPRSTPVTGVYVLSPRWVACVAPIPATSADRPMMKDYVIMVVRGL